MKQFLCLVIIIVVSFCSCQNQEDHTDILVKTGIVNKHDTIIAGYMSCTECADLYIYQGKLSIPEKYKSANSRDLKVSGNFPLELIDMTSALYNASLMFKLIGNVVLDSTKMEERVPVFYVTSFEKFYFDDSVWRGEQSKKDLYKERSLMAKGLVEHFRFKGERVHYYLDFLGKPDIVKHDKISYRIDKKTFSYRSHPMIRTLQINFSKDSMITSVMIGNEAERID